MPALEPGYVENFRTLQRAAKDRNLALVDCQDKATGKPVRVVAAICLGDDGEYAIVPLAKLFDGDPFEELNPPGYDLPEGSPVKVRT